MILVDRVKKSWVAIFFEGLLGLFESDRNFVDPEGCYEKYRYFTTSKFGDIFFDLVVTFAPGERLEPIISQIWINGKAIAVDEFVVPRDSKVRDDLLNYMWHLLAPFRDEGRAKLPNLN